MKKHLTVLTLLIPILVIGHWLTANANAIPHLQEEIRAQTKGKVSKGKYTSPDKDFTIAIPQLAQPGASIQDQIDSDGVTVTLTDDFGFFYEVVSLKNESGELRIENAAGAFKGIRENTPMKTDRGDEVRIVAIEKEGSFLTEKTAKNTSKDKIEWEERRPDLLTANALFGVNKRIYIIRAGVSLMKGSDEGKATETAKKRLESFISGLQLLSKK